MNITPLTNNQLAYYANLFYKLYLPYYKDSKQNLWLNIVNYMKYGYQTQYFETPGYNFKHLTDAPPPYVIMNILKLPGNMPERVIKETSKIHQQIINDMISVNDYTYQSPNNTPITKFKYAILCQGRNMYAEEMESVLFYNKLKSHNTFYIDIRPETEPDSISDLTIKDAKLIYHGQEVPLNHFNVITAKGCGWAGGHLFHKNKTLLFNVHQYLKTNGILQITPYTEDIELGDLEDLFHVAYDDDSAILIKID